MLFIPIAFATDNAALDHEGWAVGVAALWGYFLVLTIKNGFLFVT